ncbi:hypothetical protein GW7_05928 [Heterocephalus glaber]|uniref:Uncharacterized protein n=1 Tax=Heterocephalus glaber TaxID=10181 RepID=G5BPJ0_HETGA|nr:hypothetical protein GW7_05928 [Heterocephalus glaber]
MHFRFRSRGLWERKWLGLRLSGPEIRDSSLVGERLSRLRLSVSEEKFSFPSPGIEVTVRSKTAWMVELQQGLRQMDGP